MKVFTVEQSAKKLKVAPNTIRKWIKQGRLNAKNVGTVKRPWYRIPEESIQNFLNPPATTSERVIPKPPQRFLKRK